MHWQKKDVSAKEGERLGDNHVGDGQELVDAPGTNVATARTLHKPSNRSARDACELNPRRATRCLKVHFWLVS